MLGKPGKVTGDWDLSMILKPGKAGIYLRMVLEAVQSGETIVIKENQYKKISSE